MSYLEEMKFRLENENFPEFLQLWEEYRSSSDISVEEVVGILESVKNSEYSELFGPYAEEALSFLDKLDQPEKKGEVLRLILDLQTTQSAELATETLNYLTQKYENVPLFKEKLRLVGLRTQENFQGAIRNFELLNHMEKGKFIFHTGGWGAGEIIDISLIREQLSIEFDAIMATRELSFENAFKTLVPLQNNHFLARRFGNPDALEEEAKKDPLGVLKLLLKDLGPLNAQEIKEEMLELVIPENEWAKWWQSVRTKAKKDSKIKVPGNSKTPFILLEKEISYDDEFKKLLKKEWEPKSFLNACYSFVKQHPEVLKNDENKQLYRDTLMHLLTESEGQDLLRTEVYLFLEEFFGEKVEAALSKIIEQSQDLPYLIQSIEVNSLRKAFLKTVKKTVKSWKELFADLFFIIQHHFIREYILKELIKEQDDALINRIFQKLLESPQMYPECFVWYFQKLQGSDELPFSDIDGKNAFFEDLFILLHHIEHDSEYSELTKKIHQLIVGKHYKLYRENIANTSLELAREILLLITKCHLFSVHDFKVFVSLTKVVHPQIEEASDKATDEESESVIWTTSEGYKKVQDRIHQIATVETVDNAKEIEIARSYGDLRENSEYKFAQERRARLQAEMKLLSSQINQARIISPEDIDESKVGIGTIVSLVNQSGKPTIYTILGPWDADPDKNILSFQSQLAKAMLGHQVNESFKFKNDQYTIQEIKSFLG